MQRILKSKKIQMKKLLSILAIAGLMTACNNSEAPKEAANADSIAKAQAADSIAKAEAAAKAAADTTKKDSTAKPAADTSKAGKMADAAGKMAGAAEKVATDAKAAAEKENNTSKEQVPAAANFETFGEYVSGEAPSEPKPSIVFNVPSMEGLESDDPWMQRKDKKD